MFKTVISQCFHKKRLFKVTSLFNIISWCVLTTFLVMIGILFQLQTATFTKESSVENIYEGKQLYRIVDNYYDPDAFYEFRQHSDNINRLGEFYNALVTSTNMEFISIFNQPIYVEQFMGEEQFLYNSQEFRDAHNLDTTNANVKAIQLNQSAFELYGLKVSNGTIFDWDEVNYGGNKLPILIGSEYKGIYDIGDTFFVNYYNREITFEVVGILEPNTFVYYKGDPEFYLDQYLIVPYPELLESVNESDFKFEGILYFAMINGDIITTIDKNKLLKEIKYISDSTGFADFSVVGISDFTLKYDTMISVIKGNRNLIFIMMLLISILVTFIQYGMGNQILLRRLDVYRAFWLVGIDNYRQVFFKDISIPYILAFISTVIIIKICFQHISLLVILFILAVSLSILCLVYFICKHILKNYVMKHL